MILPKNNKEFLIRIIGLSIMLGIFMNLYPHRKEIVEFIFSILYCVFAMFVSVYIFKTTKEYELWFIGIVIISVILMIIFPNYNNTIIGISGIMLVPIIIFGIICWGDTQ